MVFARDLAGAVGAVDQDRIDIAGVGDQPLHLGADRLQLGDARSTSAYLKVENWPPPNCDSTAAFGTSASAA